MWLLPGPLRRLSPQFEFSLSAAALDMYLYGGYLAHCGVSHLSFNFLMSAAALGMYHYGGYLAHCSGWSLLPEPHRGDDHESPL